MVSIVIIITLIVDYYRPHQKNGEGNIFTGVRPSTPPGEGGVTPIRPVGGGKYLFPSQDGGYPLPSKDGGGTAFLMGGTPIFLADGGYPPPPPNGTRWGYPLSSGDRENSYVAGGMPLAFMQEDFLVLLKHL